MTALEQFGRSTVLVPDSRITLLYIAVSSAAAMAALAAVQRPVAALVAVLMLGLVSVALLRTDLPILLVVVSAPLELAVTTTIGGLSLTKIAGGLCFASFAL